MNCVSRTQLIMKHVIKRLAHAKDNWPLSGVGPGNQLEISKVSMVMRVYIYF